MPEKINYNDWGKIPSGWRGASEKQALNSAKAILLERPSSHALADHRYEISRRVVSRFGNENLKEQIRARFGDKS